MIRIPALGNPFFSQKAVIIDNDTNEILWSGRQGEIAQFHINSPKNITIKFSKNAMVSGVKEIYGCVYANKKYTCTLDHGMHMFATYHLAEVDIMV